MVLALGLIFPSGKSLRLPQRALRLSGEHLLTITLPGREKHVALALIEPTLVPDTLVEFFQRLGV